MELLNPDDTKTLLLRKSELQRQAMEDEAKLISDRTEKAITNALIIGGSLLATYFLVRQFSGSKRKAKPRKLKVVTEKAEEMESVSEAPQMPGMVAQIGTALASHATVFLLNLAKEKLAEYLEAKAEKKIKA